MCGINGIISNRLPDKLETVKRMNNAMLHRGPDEDGFFEDQHCALGMRRLSIIDLKGGQQPMFNADRSICVFMNGEIYNYQQLRKQLRQKGYIFETDSDTEVLVHLYQEYGISFISKLRGMYGFCIYDIPKKEFLLGRDPFGEKPLYYHLDDGDLSFSSEIKSLLENTNIDRRLNRSVLSEYFSLGYIAEPNTMFAGIYSLLPGSAMIKNDQGVKIFKHFDEQYAQNRSITNLDEAKDFLKPILSQAVSRQMISDVPIGAFLSGGIDSSTLCAMIQSQQSEPLKTFNVKFENADYDESKIAKEVAAHIGSDHHEISVSDSGFDVDLFWDILDHTGLPFPDDSCIPTYKITKEIRKSVKVAISGDGGDELFAGYNTYAYWLKLKKSETLPRPFRKLALKAGGLMSHLPGNMFDNTLRRVNKGLEFSLLNEAKQTVALLEMFSDKQVAHILKSGDQKEIDINNRFACPDNLSELRKIMFTRLKFGLPSDMLIKVDRMSMANSLEVRAPFLDLDLYYASLQLDDDLLMKNDVGKIILRELMKPELPKSVFNHPKTGFSIPLHTFKNKSYRDLANDLVNESSVIFDIISKDEIQKIVDLGLTNTSNNSKISVYKTDTQLYAVLQLLGWMKHFKVTV